KIDDQQHTGIYRFSDLLTTPTSEQLEQLKQLARQLQFDETINIQFTSGTTGNPKGTMLTHHNILNNGYFKTKADTRLLEGLFHSFNSISAYGKAES
ncbi:AMP-binding protein, partial [Klebsiella pneumoniae]|nr:AMP-binding protein [Klebsiella pneumoniae]